MLTTKIGFDVPNSLVGLVPNNTVKWETAVKSTGGLMIIAPLVIMYLFCQKYLVQGIERSGLTAD